MADAPLPVYTNLLDLYKDLGTSLNHAKRYDHLSAEFVKRFGRKPEYIARAPGRVNLIGEHIDYALFGVCPAAIERDILIACASREIPSASQTTSSVEPQDLPGGVIADNLHSKYARQTFAPGSSKPSTHNEASDNVRAWKLDIDTKELRWESYVKAGYYGVLDHYFTNLQSHPVPIDLLVTGTVPAGSGLSSSAAMVVASTLAFLAVNGKLEDPTEALTKGELTKMAMENETRVGVNSGGMDQAASIISNPSSALYISFFPKLEATPIPIPGGAAFVCANSLVVSDKAVSAKWQYNLRVVETLVAARILAKSLGCSLDEGKREKITLREVVGRVGAELPGEGMRTDALAELLEKLISGNALDVLKPADESSGLGVTMEEMVSKTGLTDSDFHELYLSWVEVEASHFQLHKRAKHVLSEALRVLKFCRACSGASDVLPELGNLMNESQRSCAELFECSCPEIDELTRLARQAGALGSRLTGAGWGGCTVSLVPSDKVDSFIRAIKANFGPYKGLDDEALDQAIFATRPATGACVYKFT